MAGTSHLVEPERGRRSTGVAEKVCVVTREVVAKVGVADCAVSHLAGVLSRVRKWVCVRNRTGDEHWTFEGIGGLTFESGSECAARKTHSQSSLQTRYKTRAFWPHFRPLLRVRLAESTGLSLYLSGS